MPWIFLGCFFPVEVSSRHFTLALHPFRCLNNNFSFSISCSEVSPAVRSLLATCTCRSDPTQVFGELPPLPCSAVSWCDSPTHCPSPAPTCPVPFPSTFPSGMWGEGCWQPALPPAPGSLPSKGVWRSKHLPVLSTLPAPSAHSVLPRPCSCTRETEAQSISGASAPCGSSSQQTAQPTRGTRTAVTLSDTSLGSLLAVRAEPGWVGSWLRREGQPCVQGGRRGTWGSQL